MEKRYILDIEKIDNLDINTLSLIMNRLQHGFIKCHQIKCQVVTCDNFGIPFLCQHHQFTAGNKSGC